MKNLLLLSLTLHSLVSAAFPCNKYVFDILREGKAMPGKIEITWSINEGFYGCGFAKEEILKHKFIVTFENLYEEEIFKDTVSEGRYIVDTWVNNGDPFTFTISELGPKYDNRNLIIINPGQEKLPTLDSKIDTLNFCLLNGYFLNIPSHLRDLNKVELFDQIRTEYKLLFPDNYPHQQSYFNCYFDTYSQQLVRMPTVDGLPEFTDALNDQLKADQKKPEEFKVFAKITKTGTIASYEVIPEHCKTVFDKFSHLLFFHNTQSDLNELVIIISSTRDGKKLTVMNKRALLDQRSRKFKKYYRPGLRAIH